MHPPLPVPGPRHRKQYLARYGFKPPALVHAGIIYLAAILVLAVGLGLLLHGRSLRELDFVGTDVAMALGALGALALGYQQWKEARHESSLDKYYERLDISNRRNESSPAVYEMMSLLPPEKTEPCFEKMMYVYAELDNLEYVIIKYKLGYMRPGLACRGLRAFQRRCYSPEFRSLACERVHSGDYNARTVKVVEQVCKAVEARLTSEDEKERPRPKLVEAAPAERPKSRLPRAVDLWPAIPGLLFLLGFLRHR